MRGEPNRWLGNHTVIAVLLGGIAGAVFLPAVTCGFVNWDDNQYVYDNPLVTGGATLANVVRGFTEPVFFNWAPLTIASYQIDAALWGIHPAGFHLTNIVLHALSTGMLFLVLVRMTDAPLPAAAATLLFALHPLRVEPVVWISSRKDVLSGFFLLLTLLAWERYCRRPCASRSLVAVTAAVACMLAKSTLVTLPVLLLLLDVWPLSRCHGLGPPAEADPCGVRYAQRDWPRLIAEKIPFIVVAVVFAVITLRTHTTDVSSTATAPGAAVRCLRGARALAHYLATTVWPTHLHPAYEPNGHAGIPPGVAVAVLVVAAVGIWFAATWRRFPPGFVGVGWFVAALLPVLGIATQVGQCPFADRHTYPAHIGLAVAAAWGGATLARRWRLPGWVPAVALAVVLVAWVTIDEAQIVHWRSGPALWSHVLACDQRNMVGLFKQALALEDRGELAAAEARYRDTLAVGDYTKAIAGLARVCFKQGRVEEARAVGDWAVRHEPEDPAVLEMLALPGMMPGPPTGGVEPPAPAAGATQAARAPNPAVRSLMRDGMSHARREEYREALECFRRATAADPEYAAAWNNAGMAATQLGDRAAAEPFFREAVRLAPASADYAMNLARLHAMLGRPAEALPLCERAAELAPHDPEIALFRERIQKQAAAAAGGPAESPVGGSD